MSVAIKVVNSSLLLVAARFLQRSLGLVSTLVLARILVPEDFGVVALTAMSVQLAVVLSNVGIQQYIQQKDRVDDEDLNTAWAINIALKLCLWAVLVSFAPLIGEFYNNEKVIDALRVVSFVIVLQALQNPSLHLLRRDLKYRKIFWLSVVQKLISFSVVVALAFYWKSYWAMIVGDLVSGLVGVLGSYLVSSYRPKFTFTKYHEQISFSKWMMARGILGFLRSQIDQLMVSKIFGVPALGAYNVVRGISVMPATDIIVPSAEPLLSAFAKVKGNKEKVGFQLRVSLLLVVVFVAPIAVFLWSYSEPLILLVLGEGWLEYAPLLENFCFLLVAFSLGGVLGNFYLATGRVRLVFYYNLVSLFVVAGMLYMYSGDNVAEFALHRGVLALFSTFIWMCLALYFCGGGWLRMTKICLPAFLVATIVSRLTGCFPSFDIVYLDLILASLGFFLAYTMLMLICYRVYWSEYSEWDKLFQIGTGFLGRVPVAEKILSFFAKR